MSTAHGDILRIIERCRVGRAAALSAASARALAYVLGTDAVPFTVVYAGSGGPDVTRSYPGFWAAADEQAWSRVYGGIHFPFDSLASQQMAVHLVDWVTERFMLAQGHGARHRGGRE